MKKFVKEEKGEFAIDAIFGITFFMISLIALMFMSLIIRIQSNMQYALGQTAKEISGYYYMVDKIGLAKLTSGSGGGTDVDSLIQSVVDISKSSGGSDTSAPPIDIGNISSINVYEQVSSIDWNKLKSDAEAIGANIKTITSDPIGQVKQLLSVFSKTFMNRAVNNFIAPWVCEALMPKYITSGNYSSIDEYYEAIGIKDVSFAGSQFLVDRRSIKVQVTYKLNLEKYTLGFVKGDISFRQAASTAAWVRPDDKENPSNATLVSLNMKSMGYQE